MALSKTTKTKTSTTRTSKQSSQDDAPSTTRDSPSTTVTNGPILTTSVNPGMFIFYLVRVLSYRNYKCYRCCYCYCYYDYRRPKERRWFIHSCNCRNSRWDTGSRAISQHCNNILFTWPAKFEPEDQFDNIIAFGGRS